jgi:N-methylhydantoinase B/oxoprolinase/acetone carboxylase alpha subunit
MEGGGPADMGRNTWIKQLRQEDGDLPEEYNNKDDGSLAPPGPRHINVGGKATIWMGKGDRLIIETPGGGGWGEEEAEPEARGKEAPNMEDVGVGTDTGKGEGGTVGWRDWAPRGSLAERARAQAEV